MCLVNIGSFFNIFINRDVFLFLMDLVMFKSCLWVIFSDKFCKVGCFDVEV